MLLKEKALKAMYKGNFDNIAKWFCTPPPGLGILPKQGSQQDKMDTLIRDLGAGSRVILPSGEDLCLASGVPEGGAIAISPTQRSGVLYQLFREIGQPATWAFIMAYNQILFGVSGLLFTCRNQAGLYQLGDIIVQPLTTCSTITASKSDGRLTLTNYIKGFEVQEFVPHMQRNGEVIGVPKKYINPTPCLETIRLYPQMFVLESVYFGEATPGKKEQNQFSYAWQMERIIWQKFLSEGEKIPSFAEFAKNIRGIAEQWAASATHFTFGRKNKAKAILGVLSSLEEKQDEMDNWIYCMTVKQDFSVHQTYTNLLRAKVNGQSSIMDVMNKSKIGQKINEWMSALSGAPRVPQKLPAGFWYSILGLDCSEELAQYEAMLHKLSCVAPDEKDLVGPPPSTYRRCVWPENPDPVRRR